MATTSNPYGYTSPIGSAFANLAKTLMSGPSQAERIKGAEEALKLKRTREGVTKVSDLFAGYGGGNFDPSALAAAAVTGDYDPSDLATMTRFLSANTHGATDPRTANAQVGAGGAYSSTASAFFTDQNNTNMRAANTLAEDRRQFDFSPQEALVNGVPSFVPQANTFGDGVSPILSETDRKGTLVDRSWSNLDELTPAQSRYLGTDATGGNRAPFNVRRPDGSMGMSVDGDVDVHGNKLPPGTTRFAVEDNSEGAGLTTKVTGDLQSQSIANEKFSNMLGMARGLSEDPTNFGATGKIKGFAQDTSLLAGNLAQGLGYQGLSDAAADIRAKIAANPDINPTILSGIFDPALPALQTIADLLVFSAAEALAGQEGRAVSDRDIQMFKGVVGNPQSVFASQEQFLARLDQMEAMVNSNQGVIDRHLNPSDQAPDASGGAVVDWQTYFGSQ